ncbi:cobalamin biosynthesis protein [Rhodobacteraceae bacterium HSP-20]|uniref:Cobalamin biosynthesis protein n=1 Tax=Paragemmobacter amnigenus TaxID=2852097 RepID=A0ABS6J0W7_9RHOB|nr:cobalamin biosynthesis protein [Rhodobacter amnigenus]MBU9697404.1 cobalamin biosynthesis protein [Rhodobacter amnigenus]MBV4388631.1 cobalamin biosynthesis protein [Rhodobacter amnigenus]
MRVAGIGFREGAPMESLRWVLEAAEAQGGRADALATLPAKAAALRPLAEERGLALHAVAVGGIETPTRSARIAAMHGTGSVAEAAALVAAGAGARITVARITAPDAMATCAIAETGERPR